MEKIIYLTFPYIASYLTLRDYLIIRSRTELKYRYWSPIYLIGSIWSFIIAVGITLAEFKIIK